MKAVILAGGLGTRLSEETGVRPKPMAEIGGKPILWHIMKIFEKYGCEEFIICLGYKSHVIKEYFANYSLNRADVTFDLGNHTREIHKNGAEKWKVTLVETGEGSMTGGRLKLVKKYLDGERFFFTYGDGVSDVDLNKLLEFHKQQKVIATMTAVQPPGRFGAFTLGENQDIVTSFREKPEGDGAWINGGFFVLEPEAIDYVQDEFTVWEQEPLKNLARDGKLAAYKHDGFWHPMDSLRDKNELEKYWATGKAPWKVWK
jgi:glucose-1-phosphate cytidylyltransferase